MSILVFYHAWCGGVFESIVPNQLEKIVFSGLYGAAETIRVSLVGPHAALVARVLPRYGMKFTASVVAPEDTSHERVTILAAREMAKSEDKVLYLHTKGAASPRSPANVRDWRILMEAALVMDFRDRIAELDTHDVVGVNYRQEPKPHFSGNFWWARGDYLKKLPPTIGPEYLDPEMYVCSRAPRVHNVLETGLDHYNSSCPLSAYVDAKW